MSWAELWWETQPVVVSLSVRTPLRVGAGRGGAMEVDLPALRSRLSQGEKAVPVLPTSTFKGLFRNSTKRFIESFQLGDKASEAFQRLLGSEPPSREQPGERTREGVLKVSLGPENREVLRTAKMSARMAVRLDERYGSVEKGALWDYEYITGEENLRVNFNLSFLYPIDAPTAGLLLAGLRLLKYESIGGFGSRGMGLIQEVEVKPDAFRLFAELGLRNLVK